jgi:hypothetical protein
MEPKDFPHSQDPNSDHILNQMSRVHILAPYDQF